MSAAPTTIQHFLVAATKQLEASGITTARLDCLVLLEDILNTNRTRILAHPERELSPEQQKTLNSWIKRRSTHEPLAYIRNKTEFYGREYYVDPHVLEPRPESEAMIDLLKSLPMTPNTIIADIGTGSGALAISAKLECPNAAILAVDIDNECLKVARKNAKLLNASIKFLRGDLLAPLTRLVLHEAILLCNLPYVPDSFQINPAAMREPRLAIFGGEDGLDLYRRLFKQIHDAKSKLEVVLTEALPPQHPALTAIADSAGYRLEATNDFIQLFRRDSDSSVS